MVTIPPSLLDPGLTPVWQAVRGRLEQQGLENRGRLRLATLTRSATIALSAVIERPLTAMVDLDLVERGLVRLGVGADLAAALGALGHPVSPQPAARRAEQARQRTGRQAARHAAATWPEPWAQSWIDSIIRAGVLRDYDETTAVAFVATVRQVLDLLSQRAVDHFDREPLSRVELAARLLGDAHALDTGTRLEVAVSRALALALPLALPLALEGAVLSARPAPAADPWSAAGVHRDLVSGPVLTWNLPLAADSGLGRLSGAATELGVPLHLTQLALLSYPVELTAGATVLVVENPRVVEAAAQRRATRAVMTTNGNPSVAAALLIKQLVTAGARVRYHGDFDAAGLVICARLAALGAIPWRMTVHHYRAALVEAEHEGVSLPLDPTAAPPTPWDPPLQQVFDAARRVVHEERLLDQLLA